MKRISIIFLQIVLVLIGIVAVTLMIRLPALEGRAEGLDVISIYSDPFILYGYATSIAFFIGLYKAFRLLGYIGQNRLFTLDSIHALKVIKYCAIIISASIVMAALYISISHHPDDDPAGFIGMSVILTFIFITIATAVTVLERILQNAVDMKSENDLTI
ncbi:MAG: DUF2975 domain-containing protein [Cyclobacteriaceae bacterium]|nr:DUF2975 domain-containing protein [Cyclobacteriaceae bacterium SS2]